MNEKRKIVIKVTGNIFNSPEDLFFKDFVKLILLNNFPLTNLDDITYNYDLSNSTPIGSNDVEFQKYIELPPFASYHVKTPEFINVNQFQTYLNFTNSYM